MCSNPGDFQQTSQSSRSASLQKGDCDHRAPAARRKRITSASSRDWWRDGGSTAAEQIGIVDQRAAKARLRSHAAGELLRWSVCERP
jgi:hypothetical protein